MINTIRDSIRTLLQDRSGLRSRFVLGAGGTLVLKIANAGLLFVVSVLLARLLGARGYGAYAYAVAVVSAAGVPALVGFNQLLIRELAALRTSASWSVIRGLILRANQIALATTGAIIAASVLVFILVRPQADPLMISTLLAALPMLPLLVLVQIRNCAMRGFDHVVAGQVPEAIVQLMVFVALVLGTLAYTSHAVSPQLAVLLFSTAFFVTLLIANSMMNRRLPSQVRAATPIYEDRQWFKSAVPMMLIGIMQLLNTRTDVILLGILNGPEDVGIYTICSRGAGFILMIQASASIALAPMVASLHASGQSARLQKIVTRSVRLTFVAAMLLGAVLVFFGYWFLLIFGQEFTQGRVALVILSLGYLASVALAL